MSRARLAAGHASGQGAAVSRRQRERGVNVSSTTSGRVRNRLRPRRQEEGACSPLHERGWNGTEPTRWWIVTAAAHHTDGRLRRGARRAREPRPIARRDRVARADQRSSAPGSPGQRRATSKPPRRAAPSCGGRHRIRRVHVHPPTSGTISSACVDEPRHHHGAGVAPPEVVVEPQLVDRLPALEAAAEHIDPLGRRPGMHRIEGEGPQVVDDDDHTARLAGHDRAMRTRRPSTTFTPSARSRLACSGSWPGTRRPLAATTRHHGSVPPTVTAGCPRRGPLPGSPPRPPPRRRSSPRPEGWPAGPPPRRPRSRPRPVILPFSARASTPSCTRAAAVPRLERSSPG